MRYPARRSFIQAHPLLFAGGILSASLFLLVVACCGGLIYSSGARREAAQKELAEANALWDAGKKAEAASKYASVLDRDYSDLPPATEKPVVYQRVIDQDLERSDKDAARARIEKALDKKIDIAPGSPGTIQLIAQVRADRERREAEEQAAREAEDRRKRAEETRRNEARAEAKRKQRELILGEWSCTSEISGGETVHPGYHKKWAFDGNQVTINGERTLWYRVDEDSSPRRLTIYNEVKGRKIDVYACIYKFEGEKLIVCCDAGDTFPDDFPAGRSDVYFLLTFTK